MKIVGLTGGIGSGKTTVAKMFQDLGIPIYIADDESKRIVNSSKIVKRKLIALLGERAYHANGLDRSYVADQIFNDSGLLAEVNAIIHPKVRQHFKRWIAKQKAPYCIKEAAILFESGSYKDCDFNILVTAPKEIRIARVVERDTTTKELVEHRMDNQWSDAKKRKLADVEIVNDTLSETRKAVKKLHDKLSKGQ